MDLAWIKFSVERYTRGKSWYWYLPLWLFGLYAYVQLFSFNMVEGRMSFVVAVPYSFDFFLHEMAHLVTAFLPPVLTASAGSLSELALGIVLVVIALRQRSYFASLFCFLWFDLTCQSAGTYMADAVPQRLPLVSIGAMLSGGDPIHDWNFVFGHLHLLWASALIGNTIRVIGVLAGLFGVVFTGWLLFRMSQAPRRIEDNESESGALYPEEKPNTARRVPDEGYTSLPLSYRTPESAAPPSRSDGNTASKK